jgi:MFS family permease
MTTLSPDAEAQQPSIPRKYWVWLAGSSFASLGTQILGFAMAWVAAGYGGAFAGLVLTAINLPRTVLLLIGGAVSDRIGAWRVMISGDVAMTVVTSAFAVCLFTVGSSPWLLLGVAFLIGVVDAFYMPSSGSMPRRLVDDAKLTQAMSAKQISMQLSSVLGGPLGSLVVLSFGIAAAATVNSVTFAAMFVLLALIRPRGGSSQPPSIDGQAPKQRVVRDALNGLQMSLKDPLLRPILLILVGCSAFLLPVLVPLLPVLARQSGWEATQVGLVVGVSALSTAAVAVWVVVTGGLSKPGLAGCGGIICAALGVLGLALSPGLVTSVVSGALIGLGTGLFTTHLGPLVLGSTPRTHLGRIQALVAIAQSLPLLITNVFLGAMAQAVGAGPTLILCGVALITIAVAALGSKELRNARRLGTS